MYKRNKNTSVSLKKLAMLEADIVFWKETSGFFLGVLFLKWFDTLLILL